MAFHCSSEELQRRVIAAKRGGRRRWVVYRRRLDPLSTAKFERFAAEISCRLSHEESREPQHKHILSGEGPKCNAVEKPYSCDLLAIELIRGVIAWGGAFQPSSNSPLKTAFVSPSLTEHGPPGSFAGICGQRLSDFDEMRGGTAVWITSERAASRGRSMSSSSSAMSRRSPSMAAAVRLSIAAVSPCNGLQVQFSPHSAAPRSWAAPFSRRSTAR